MLRHKVTVEKVTKSEIEVYQSKKEIQKSMFLYIFKLKKYFFQALINHHCINLT